MIPVVALRQRFPGLVFWFGAATGKWWALVWTRRGWRLIEAIDPVQLGWAVANAQR